MNSSRGRVALALVALAVIVVLGWWFGLGK